MYEFLQFYKMEYSLSVFKNEGNIKGKLKCFVSKSDVKREELAKKVGLKSADSSKPLLMQLLQGGVEKGSSQTP